MNVLKKLLTGNDPRSSEGMFARGKAIYRNGSHAAKGGPTAPTTDAIARRLGRQYNGHFK